MGQSRYHEELLHWIWQNRQLKGNLKTAEGKSLMVHRTGKLNPTDGPDFTGAKIAIGNLIWYGDVEIHWEANDWYKHNHHTDPNYESVVLHVVFNKPENLNLLEPAIPSLFMKPFLDEPLRHFFKGFNDSKGLPCSRKMSFISPAALEAQIAKAHRRYFQKKVDGLLHFYDPALPPSKAWRKLLIIGLFDGLGIAHNREPMRKLAKFLFNRYHPEASLSDLKELALTEAFAAEGYRWKKKGSRPSNHPEPRIKQGCELLSFIMQASFKSLFEAKIKETFTSCINNVDGLGQERAGVLFGIVWLPAFYLLGELFGSTKLTEAAERAWMQHRTSLPESIVRPFRQSGVPEFIYKQKPGAVHQLKSYCRARRCHRCEVFKSAIST